MSTMIAGRVPALHLSPSARRWLDDRIRARGEEYVLVLRSCCAAPSIVHVRRAADFEPADRETVVTVVDGLPVWGDPALLGACPHQSLLVEPTTGSAGSRHLLARPDDPAGGRRA